MTNLDRLRADLQALPANYRVLVWSGFDQSPYDGTMFREYLFTRAELLAALTGQPAPPPTTIRVRTTAALNVRSAPVIGDNIVIVLARGTIIEVYEVETVSGWKQISSGQYAGKWVSSQYVTKVD